MTQKSKSETNKNQSKKPKIPYEGNKSRPTTALVLSGGGSRGAYQIGAWRALIELGWTFDMVIGVSAGSLNGAMVVQDEMLLSENLWRELETDNIFDVSKDAQSPDFALEFLKQGGAGSNGLKKFVDNYIDDERVRKSPVDFGLLTVAFPSMKPLYLWKKDIPKGQIGDYVMASSSAFPAIQPYEIDGKLYIDGGYENNMPIHMAADRGAKRIAAVYLDAIGKVDIKKELAACGDAEVTLIRPAWELGNFLLFDKTNTARIIRLGYMDAMKSFGVYDGNYYSFIKGEFDKRKIPYADAAAKAFELDPLILYSRKLLLETLRSEVDKAIQENKDILNTFRKISKNSTGVPAVDIKQAFDTIGNSNKKVAILFIARDLKEHGANSLFINRYALRLMGDEIKAARFLDKADMV